MDHDVTGWEHYITSWVTADSLYPPHEVRDRDKYESILARMTARGWVGRPLVTCGDQCYTGSHRLAAAQTLGVRVPIHDFSVDYQLDDEAWQEFYEATDDDLLIIAFERLGLKEAAELLRREVDESLT